MKIVHIEDFFHPDAGYQVNILSKYQVNKGNSVTVVTSDMRKIPENLKSFFGGSDIEKYDRSFTNRTGVYIIRLPILKYYSGRSIYTWKLYKVLKELNPDILFVHGNDSFAGVLLTLFRRRLNFPMIMDNHMLEMASVNRFNKLYNWSYRSVIKPIITRERIKVIRLVNDDFLIKNLGIPRFLSPVISFGTDIMQFHPDPVKRTAIRKANNINPEDFVVLYMGKLTEDKGVLLLANAFKEKISLSRRVILVVVGTVSSEYGRTVEKVFNASENTIIRFPTQKYSDLPEFYHLSDAAVFPRHCSLSFYDAQACGIPVIVENNTINVNRVTTNNGILFQSGDYKDLREKIIYMASLPADQYAQMKQSSIDYIQTNQLDYNIIADQYDRILKESIAEFKN